MEEKITDVLVIGAGIVGLSTAREIQQQHPEANVVVVDAEKGPAMHQTGRNSGVIHAGVYYQPGSLKAQFCRSGNQEIKAFCDQHEIEYFECGKLLVATDEQEYERLEKLIDRAAQNQVPIEVMSAKELHQFEPNVVGLGAIFVPSTAIVDYRQIAEKLAENILNAGGRIYYGQALSDISETETGVEATCGSLTISAKRLVACTGMNSDKVVEMLGDKPSFRMIPFRGEYFKLSDRHRQLVRHLIYPVPNPDLPFLGVHVTRMINGDVTVGPNAVLNMSRDGYAKWAVNFADLKEMWTYRGFHRLIFKHWRSALGELLNSGWQRGYLKQVQKYCSSVTLDDLTPHRAGIRAQAVTRDGEMIDDFLFHQTKHCVVVCNAPSPAATSCFPIARHIVAQLAL
uniref:L-2-hydroxyglutarate oxidase n=1 Tax=Thaumasiovibrio occultus TaxID=1891184 RepID=UPI000B353E8A|nr:L-2-hydroxyglutarate oxidase [Thaumasiovibrio occultus]